MATTSLIFVPLIMSLFSNPDPVPVNDIDITESIVQVRGESPEVDENGNRYGGMCTGTVIAQDKIITANHCFTTFTENPNIIVDGEKIGIINVNPHPTEDIAIATLENNVKVSIAPLSTDKPKRGEGYIHYGLSNTDKPKKSTMHYKHTRNSRIDDYVNPVTKVVYGLDYDSHLNVTQYDHLGHGDSGGPFVNQGMVSGVIAAIIVDKDGTVTGAKGTMLHHVSEWVREQVNVAE